MSQLFKNYAEALTFAFAYSTQQYAQSPTAKLMKSGRVGTGKGLVALDGAAQAGMILAEVQRLAPLHRHCIVARYAPKLGECRCCGGETMGEDFKMAVAALGDWALTTFSGISNLHMRRAIIRSYFDRSVKIGAEADKLNIARRTAYDLRSKILNSLKTLDTDAHSAISESLAWLADQEAA